MTEPREPARRSRALWWVFGGFLAVAAFFLWTEHRAHVFGFLPFLLVGACLLMHLFHRGHDDRGHGEDRAHEHGGRR